MRNKLTSNSINRVGIRLMMCLVCCSTLLLFISSCGKPSTARMELPNTYEIQSQGKLPIDGTWELQLQSKVGAVFKIEDRKMYVYANYGPAAWHGMTIAKNIRQIKPLKYGCEYATVNRSGKKVGFGRGEIDIVSEDTLQIKYYPNPITGHTKTGIDHFSRMRLDDESWFLSELRRGKQ